MRQAQVLAYALDAPLAARLQETARDHGFWLREVQQVPACRGVLKSVGPAVLILTLGRDVAAELALVEEVARLAPDVALVVVTDTDNPALAALAWDLGACCVLGPAQPIELLPEIAVKLLQEKRG
jgi:hypothetical protein